MENKMPDGIKEAIDRFLKDEDNAEDVELLLSDLNLKAALSDDARTSVAKAIALLNNKEIAEAKIELTKILDYYSPPKEEEETEGKFQFHIQVKSVKEEDEERIIEGYANVTGVMDRDGEIMDKTAFDKGLEEFMENPILLLNHDKTKPVGSILKAKVDDVGLFIRAQVAKGTEAAEEAWKLVQQKVLRSLSVGGIFKKTGNKIKQWDLTEISIVAVPANQRSLFSVVKAFELGNDLVDSKIDELIEKCENLKEKFWITEDAKFIDDYVAKLKDVKYSDGEDVEEKAKELYESCEKEVNDKMDKDFQKVVDEVKDQIGKDTVKAVEEKTAKDAHDKEVAEAAVKDYKAKMKEKSADIEFPDDENEAKDGDGHRIKVFGKYDHLDLEDVTFAHTLYKAAGIPISRDLAGALGEKAAKHFGTREGRKDFGEGTKADELNYSTSSTYGDEWVPELEASTLWAKIQMAAKVAPLFKSFTMPSNPYIYPLDTSGPTIYTVAEATASTQGYPSATPGTSSRIVTGKQTFTAKKMGALTYFSEELIEDSIIPILTTLKSDFYDAMTRGLDRALISGDEAGATGTTNISYYGSAESSAAWYAVTDGLRHESLVTTSADSVSVGTLTLDDIRSVQALMGTAGKLGINPADLVLICDPGVSLVMADLDEVVTLDKMGPKATILTGMLGAIKGIPIVAVEEYDLTNSSGYIHATAANNTVGSFLLVNKKGVMIGYRRKLSMTVDRIPYSDMRYIIASIRFDVQYRETGCVGLGYNVTI